MIRLIVLTFVFLATLLSGSPLYAAEPGKTDVGPAVKESQKDVEKAKKEYEKSAAKERPEKPAKEPADTKQK